MCVLLFLFLLLFLLFFVCLIFILFVCDWKRSNICTQVWQCLPIYHWQDNCVILQYDHDHDGPFSTEKKVCWKRRCILHPGFQIGQLKSKTYQFNTRIMFLILLAGLENNMFVIKDNKYIFNANPTQCCGCAFHSNIVGMWTLIFSPFLLQRTK